MSGASAASAAAAANATTYVMTTGSPGAGIFGWSSGSYGVLTPTTLKGSNLLSIRSNSAIGDLIVEMTTTGFPQNFFRHIVVELNSAGQFVQFATTAAVYVDAVATSWRWGSGSGPVWTSSAIVRRILIFS